MQYPFSFAGPQYATRVIRRVFVSNESPNDHEQFLTRANEFFRNDFPPMVPTTEPTRITTPQPFSLPSKPNSSMITDHHPFYQEDDSPPPSPTKPNSSMITHHPYYEDHSPVSAFPSKVEPPKINRGYYNDESATVPFRANPPMIRGGYYHNESSTYPPRHDPYGGHPVNLHLNVYLRPQDSGYPGYGNYNGQNGGGPYNPQVQGGNGVGGNGKVTLGPEINGANLNIGGGKAGGGDVGGDDKKKKKKKKKKENDSSDQDGQQAKKDNDSSDRDGQAK
ncbi:hypothetical protein CKAN_01910100 [Cinnamomum micranthum f. kanehirae]|uniref:Uncharacterized protein n=1 Tax=Cinnamomum micranthum f. kanehirae TaxID=337451 RepID=A0A3S3N819_9MAGN|nr:hypothetical protein CKAN_01910100 [Cinnamomum micranthum f. kanehirae]